jgi:gliding motility-associated protein GldC
MSKKSKINIEVALNDQNFPESIEWSATDNPHSEDKMKAKGMMLSFFDVDTKDTFKIDLWTTEMQVVEMDRFIFQTLKSIADTYHKSTGNTELANDMQRFVRYFGECTEIIPKEE